MSELAKKRVEEDTSLDDKASLYEKLDFCIAWGPLEPGLSVHPDCPVVLHSPAGSAISSALQGSPFPRVCPCECQICKRAWWAAGRPVNQDGEIVLRY